MVTCIQCGTTLDEGETTCGRCGAAAPRPDAGSGSPAGSPEPGETTAGETGDAQTSDTSDGAVSPSAEESDAGAEGPTTPVAAVEGDAEASAPAGTWSEDTGEQTKLPEGVGTGERPKLPDDEARPSTPAVIKFREADQTVDERPDDAPALRPERIVRDPDLTPVPGLALALASAPNAQDEESTGTRPTVQARDRADSGERRMGQVVPLRREPRGDRESSAEIAQAATTARVSREDLPDDDAPAPEEGAATARRVPPESEETGKRPVEPPEPPRKPVLASDILREDLAPTEPGRTTLRWTSVGLGTLGAGTVLAIAGASVLPIVVSALLLGIAVVGALPARYEARAIAIAALGVSGLAVTIVATGVAAVPPVLAIATLVLGSGLMFRGTYRASVPSRWMVAIGIGLGILWFGASGTASGLTVMDVTWQSIGSSVIRLTFVLLLMLSLLAFMDSSTTAGCRQWGTGVLLWYAVFVVFETAVRMWPPAGFVPPSAPDGIIARFLPGQTGGELTGEVAALTLAGAAFVFATGFAGSQILVSASGGTTSKRRKEGASDSTPSGEVSVDGSGSGAADASRSSQPTATAD